MAELDTSQGGGKKHGKGKKRSKKVSTRVDLTPMVDLAFLLVTFFMLTTTFSKPQTMEINMPVKDKTQKVTEQAVKASNALTIILGKDDKIYYYFGEAQKSELKKTDFAKTGIRNILLETTRMNYLKNGDPNPNFVNIDKLVVLIKATNDANYKNVVDILDEMNICGIKKYALVDLADPDKELMKKSNL